MFQAWVFGLLGGLGGRQHRNEGAAFKAFLERHLAFDGREDGVVAAHADASAREPFGAALTNDDVARNGRLAAEQLYAQTTDRGVAAVA